MNQNQRINTILRATSFIDAATKLDSSSEAAQPNSGEIHCAKFEADDHLSFIAPGNFFTLVHSSQNTNGTLHSNLSGEVRQTEIRAGVLTLIPPNTSQHYDFRGKLTNTVLQIDTGLFARVAEMDQGISERDVYDARLGWIRPSVAVLVEEQYRALVTQQAGSRILAESIALRLAYELFSAFGEQPKASAAKPLSDTEMTQLLDFIEDEMEQNFDLTDLAAQLDRDPFGFSRSFRDATGTSPHQYVIHRRVMRVKELLHSTDDPLSDISYATGFSNQSHMTSTFTKHVGVSPGKWRRALRS